MTSPSTWRTHITHKHYVLFHVSLPDTQRLSGSICHPFTHHGGKVFMSFHSTVYVSPVRITARRDNTQCELRRIPAVPSFQVNRLDEMILSPSHDVHYFSLSERKKYCFLRQTNKPLSQIQVLLFISCSQLNVSQFKKQDFFV